MRAISFFILPFLAAVSVLALTACGQAPTPTPTPNLGRLSDEAVKEMLWLYQIMLPAELEVALIVTIGPAGSGGMEAYYKDRARQANYASLYLAMQCHNGVEASVSGFRIFIAPLLGMLKLRQGDHDSNTMAIAKDTIEQIVSRAQARKQLGLSPIKEPCERPYIAPQSAAEAELATGLITAYRMLDARRRLGGFAFESFNMQSLIESASAGAIVQWFSKSDAQEIGFLDWAWRKACQEMQVTC